MKRFLLMGVAIIALLSCSKDIIKDVNTGAAIEFSVAAQTRAQETTTASLNTFFVTAVDPRQSFNYFTDVAFIKVDGIYHSSPTYFWPGDGSTLDFYAYAPSSADLGASVAIGKDAQKLVGFSPAQDISEQKDFITAVTSGPKDSGTSTVPLSFEHKLTQIEIKAKNSNPGQIYHVKGVKIAQIKSKGDYDFASQKWSLDDKAAKAVYTVEYDNVRILDPYGVNIMNTAGDNITDSYSDNAMLLPQEITSWDPQADQQNENKGAYIAVLMKITTSSGASVTTTDENNEYQWVAAPFPEGTTWEAGNKYIYTLDFTNGASYSDPELSGGGVLLQSEIIFDVDIIPWNEKVSDIGDHPLIGDWNLVNASLAIKWNEEHRDEIFMPTVGAVKSLDFLGDGAFSIKFVSQNSYYLYNEDILYYTSYVDGELYISESDEIKISEYSDDTMSLYARIEEILDSSTGETVVLEYRMNYYKSGKEPEEQDEQWKTDILGEWHLKTFKQVFTPDDGSDPTVVEYGTLEDIVQGNVDETFYKLLFNTHKECVLDDGSLLYTMFVNGQKALTVDIDTDFRDVVAMHIDISSNSELNLTATAANSMGGVDGIEYVNLHYERGTAEEYDPVELLGDWYFHDSMMVMSSEDKIQERRWFNSFDLAKTMPYAVSSVNFPSTSSIVINVDGTPISSDIINSDGILYLDPSLIPVNMTVCITDYSESHMTLEISFIDSSDNMSYRYIQNFTRESNTEGENWMTNLCGTWEFDKIVYTYIDDTGKIIDTVEDSTLDEGSPFGRINFAWNSEDYCFDGTFEGVKDFKAQTTIQGGLYWLVDKGTSSISFYITDITSYSLSLCQTARVEHNGVETYQEVVVYYNKCAANE